MTGQPQDPSDRPPAFGPNRHRMEIELMEKRFRERSDRSGGGPVATEEIDIRIADEARAFFDDSARTLEAVVPRLQEGDQGREMVETTGEIRKKIDQFFTDSSPEVPSTDAAPSRRGVSPSAPAPAPSSGAASAAQMDLKTALEKLRRHGVAKASGQAPARPASPPPSRSVLDSSASLEARPFSAPPRPAASESAAAALSEVLPSMDTTGSIAPPPRSREGSELLRQLSSLPPLDTDEARLLDEPQPTLRGGRSADAPRSAPAVPDTTPARDEPVREEPVRDELDADEPARERPRVPAPDIAAVGEFDSIFSAVEGIVLDTLKSSMNETMSAARKSEPELANVAVPTADPIVDPIPDAHDTATQDLSQDLSEKLEEGEKHDESVEISDDTQDESMSFSHEAQDVSESLAEAAAPKLAAPREDDEDEDAADGVAPATPYDWGVKPVARPRGAWLLDTPDESAESVAPAKPAAEQPAPAAEAPSVSGPRAFLIRKASDEVRRFQPVVDALVRADVVDGDEFAPKAAAPLGGDDDDAVSLDSFHDDRPSHEEVEQELSPMRLVEELRRLRRLTQALVEKGVISASDVEKSDSE